MPGAKITALGCYVPPRVLTNHDLEKLVDTSDEWIMQRVGIRERHIAPPEMATSDMAVLAACATLAQRGIPGSDVECILLCTVTPDMMFPSTACLVQHRIGAKGAWGFDLVAACSGFLYGLTTAAHLIVAGAHKNVLVIGSDTMSRIIDYTDRVHLRSARRRLRCDAAEATAEPGEGFLGFLNEIDGSGGDYLKMPAGGSRLPASAETVANRQHFVKQEGQQVFKYAVHWAIRNLPRSALPLRPHAAGHQTVDSAPGEPQDYHRRRPAARPARRSGDYQHRSLRQHYGRNHSPGCARRPRKSGRLKKGDLVLFAAVGAGFTVGANLWKWEF